MKLRSVFFAACLSVPLASIFAGGIVTNTNQSATWTRNPSTAASLGTEAVYYNPAATALLGPGLSFSISNQSIFQKREIENFYSQLNQNLYKGTVNAPVFPTIYAAYNINRLSVSFGFNPIGGGGSAEFQNGLPAFALPPSDLVPALAKQGVTDYRLDAYFQGSSIYLGYQFGIAYKINDNISVFGGLRYVAPKNTYEGYLRNVEVNAGGNWIKASDFLAGISAQLQSMTTVPASLQPLIDGGGGSLTLAQAQGAGYIPADKRAQIEQGLAAILTSQNIPVSNIPYMNIAQIQGAYSAASPSLLAQAQGTSLKSRLLRDQNADVEQTGSGITPIIGVNLSLLEKKLNIGIKYEFATQMEVKNKTTLDFVTDSVLANGTNPARAVTMFPNGAKIPADMPALLSVGVSYKMLDKLSLSSSLYYYFDKSVEYGKKLLKDGQMEYVKNDEVIDGNFIDWALGAEYQINSKLLVSTGYMFGKQDVKQTFQSDMNYSISSHTYCVGGKYSISPKFDVNLGLSWSKYEKGKKHAAFSKNSSEIALETYMKDTFIVGVGVDIRLSK